MIVPGELLFVEEAPEEAYAEGGEADDRDQDAEQAFFAAGTVAIEINQAKLYRSHTGRVAAAKGPQDLVEEGYTGGDDGVGAEVKLGEAELDAAQIVNRDQNPDTDGDHGHVVGDGHGAVGGDGDGSVNVEGSLDGAGFEVLGGEGELLLDLKAIVGVEGLVALPATGLSVALLGGAGGSGGVW